VSIGGSVGREEATGRGVMNVLRKFLDTQGKTLTGTRVAVQGFGNVGYHAARLLDDRGATVIAISEKGGGIYDDAGVDIEAAGQYYRESGTLAGFPGGDAINNEELVTCECDVLAPCAMENTIDADVAPHVKAKIVVEGANGPTTPDADAILRENGITVLPDILANAGGVTTSYFEWVQDRHGYFWEEDEVNRRLEAKMCEAFKDVLDTSIRYKTDLRTAAYIVAINRVATVTKMRGMYA